MRQKLTSRPLLKNIFQQRYSSQLLHQRAQNLAHASVLLKAKRRRFNLNFARFMPTLNPKWILANTSNEYKAILGEEKGIQCQAYIDKRVRMHTMAYKTAQEIAGKNLIIKAYTRTLTKLLVAQTGMGECDEQTNYCFALSHARGRLDITKACLNLGTGSTGQKYPHLFLLIGKISHEKLPSLLLSQGGALENLGKLPDHLALLDPLNECVCSISDWIKSPLKNYINVHQEALNSTAIIEGIGVDQHADQDVYLDLISIAEEYSEQCFAGELDSLHSRSNSM